MDASSSSSSASSSALQDDALMEGCQDDTEYVLSLSVHPDESVAVAAWSDLELRLYDLSRGLSSESTLSLKGHTERITGASFGDLASDKASVFSCAEDGQVLAWDARSGGVAQRFSTAAQGKKRRAPPAGCLAVGCDSMLVAVGTDEEQESRVLFFDRRSTKQLGAYTESHVDSVSQLCFNPVRKTQVASGSMDGLVCYFDVAKPDEDTALLSVLNVGSAVARIGFFGPSYECLFSLTHCETLTLYHADKALTMAAFPGIRETLSKMGAPSDYLVDCCYLQGSASSKSQSLILVSGDHQGRLHLSDVTLGGINRLCSVADTFGHSADVRAVTLFGRDPDSGVPARMLTGGEDGSLCDWRHAASEAEAASVGSKASSKATRKGAKARAQHAPI